jgi:O-antigen/teichoic acid export membrane protein
MVFSVSEEYYAKEYYSKILTYFCFLALFLALLVSVLAEDVIKIISTESYWESYKIVPIVCLAYIVWGINDLLSAEILLSRKTYYFTITTCVGAICNIILNTLLIPSYGMMGAAVATLVSFLLVASMRYVIGQSLNRICYEWYRVTKLIVIWLLMFVVLSYLPIESTFISVFVKSICCLIYPLLLLVVRFYDEQEREQVREYFRRIWEVTGASQS